MNRLLFNFHDVILLMTTYQCVLFALFLLTLKREKCFGNLLLSLFLASHAAIPLDILINFGAAFRDWAITASPNLFYTFGFAYWLEGPLLLWYTRSLVYKNYRLRYLDLIYLIPFFTYGIYKVWSYYMLDFSSKIYFLQEYSLLNESSLDLAIGFIRETLRTGFGVMCLLEIRKARTAMKHSFSSIEKIDFSWLNILVVGFLILRLWAVLVSLAIILRVHFDFGFNYGMMGLVENYTVLILISALIYFSLGYSTIFEGIEEKNAQEQACKNNIDPTQVERLVQTMHTEKPYLINALTLEQLATQAGIPARSVSTIVNRHFNRNFFEFINHYRIEEAKKLLSSPLYREKNILDIMLEVGFNSKATFNTFFKKFEGITPSQYRKQSLLSREKTATVFHEGVKKTRDSQPLPETWPKSSVGRHRY